MDHRVDPVIVDDPPDERTVADVCDLDGYIGNCLSVRAFERVQHDDVFAAVHEKPDGVRPDGAGPARSRD
jgi:hypothetical protein